jgi:hypothetical protein
MIPPVAISVVVSVPLVVIAFNVNRLKRWIKSLWQWVLGRRIQEVKGEISTENTSTIKYTALVFWGVVGGFWAELRGWFGFKLRWWIRRGARRRPLPDEGIWITPETISVEDSFPSRPEPARIWRHDTEQVVGRPA